MNLAANFFQEHHNGIIKNSLLKDISPQKNYIISIDMQGNVLSAYGDDIWNLQYLKTMLATKPTLDFNRFTTNLGYREEIKWIVLLLLAFGKGRKNKQYNLYSIQQFFRALSLFYVYANKKKISIFTLLSTDQYLNIFIRNHSQGRSLVKSYLALFKLLRRIDNNLSKINFKYNEKLVRFLNFRLREITKNDKQTEIIPTNILYEVTKQRWRHIEQAKEYLPEILSLIKYFIKNRESYSLLSERKRRLFTKKVFSKRLVFKKLGISSRRAFTTYIGHLQSTCIHLILTYSGMRLSEVLSLKIGALTKDNDAWFITSSAAKKRISKKEMSKWVTSKEVQKIFTILEAIAQALKQSDHSEDFLFIRAKLIEQKSNVLYDIRSSFTGRRELPLDETKLIILDEDIKQLELVEYNRDWQGESSFQLGKIWTFLPHQYRRSLSVYSLNSGLVSMGSLQIQLNHLFKEMSFYYGKSSESFNIFQNNPSHISQERSRISHEIFALAFFNEIMIGDEQNYGSFGLHVDKNKIKINTPSLVLEERAKTIKRFKNGEIAWQTTPIGGCVKIGSCEDRMTRSLIACTGCPEAIIKVSKLQETIAIMEKYIIQLDKNSIEYHSEVSDLNLLKQYMKTLKDIK